MGVNAFIDNGLRPTLVPVLMSFFQNRKMVVKWHNNLSTIRDLPGGGPQGTLFGGIEFDVNSNSNANHIAVDMKFKFVDDLSILEIINLIIAGLRSYNFKQHVALIQKPSMICCIKCILVYTDFGFATQNLSG